MTEVKRYLYSVPKEFGLLYEREKPGDHDPALHLNVTVSWARAGANEVLGDESEGINGTPKRHKGDLRKLPYFLRCMGSV